MADVEKARGKRPKIRVRIASRRKAVREWFRTTNLFSAVGVSVVLSVCVAFAAYLVLYTLLPVGGDPIQPKDLVQFSVAVAAGIGGVVALVVAYRRQQGIELGRFVERFGAAAGQLGSSDVAVRLAGAYAMAGVADDAIGHERQQCIDVLCGYLRLPYSPDIGSSNENELVHKVPARGGKESHEHRYLYRQNDREVRLTIVRVIAAHLQPAARVSWSACNFDFRRAHLEDVDFATAVFRGRTTFRGATFSGAITWFHGATFGGTITGFYGVTFGSGRTLFDEATFGSDLTNFDEATFSSNETNFEGVTFGSNETRFHNARFSRGKVSFNAPKRWEPAPRFDWDDDLPEGQRRPKPPNVLPMEWPPRVQP